MRSFKDINQSGLWVYYTGLLFAFFMPFGKQLLLPFIVLFLFSLLISPGFGKKSTIKKSRNYFIIFSSFYVLHVTGMLYTTNISRGLSDLEIKASLILFPLFFILSPNFLFGPRFFSGIVTAFFLGCFGSVFFSFIISSIQYFETGSLYVFYYSNSSYFLHTSYISMYIIFAIFSMVVINAQIKGKTIYFILSGFLIFYLNLFSSKSGFITFFLAFVLMIIFLLYEKRFKRSVFLLIGALAMFLSSLFIFPESSGRIKVAVETIKTNESELKQSGESTADRLLIWKTALELSRQNLWLGTGTGDVKDELVKKYIEKGMNHPAQLKLNAHNQFIQSFVALGFPALTVLILIFLIPLWLSFRKKYWVYFAFILFFAFNIMVESMLEVQAGIVYFAFWNLLLWIKMQEKE